MVASRLRRSSRRAGRRPTGPWSWPSIRLLRGLEIVTGRDAAVVLDDRTCGLVALAMTSSFAAGDLVGGIRNGLQVMADHGRNSRTVHLDTF